MSSSVGARYETLLDLAAGGMATVHLARRVGAAGFDRLVVIKRIHRHLAANADFHTMLVDEAHLSSNVHHPNVVPVVDVIDEGGELSLVMDYVESVSLAALLEAARRRSSKLAPDVVARICTDVLLGLHAAHEAVDASGNSLSIVHRDVSPQNVIVGTDGSARLIDFGIAKARERVTITKDDSLKGKLRYMSPEQGRRDPLDRRSDLFALGLVLYEAMTNCHAVQGTDDASIWISLMSGDFAPTSDLPGPIATVLERALERRADNRFATAMEFERALRAAAPPASGEAVTACLHEYLGPTIDARREAIREARKLPHESIEVAVVQDAPIVDTLEPVAPRRRRATRWIGLLAIVGITIVGIVVRSTQSKTTTDAHRLEPPAPSATVPSATVSVTPPSSSASTSPVVASNAPVAASAPNASPAKKPVRLTPPAGKKLRDNPYTPAPPR